MASLKKEMTTGVFWSAVGKYSGFVVSLIVSMILARLLSPNEFGIVAIATVLIQFLSMISTMGFGPAVIQRNDLNESDLDNIFTFSIYSGSILASLLIVFSPYIASYYDNDILVSICIILSFCILTASANIVPEALMSKNKRFKDIAKRTLLLQLISGSLSVLLAYNGFGVYSLLISPIFSGIGILIYNLRFYPRKFVWHLSFEPIKRVFSYSIYLVSFDFINFFGRNLDKFLVSSFLSTESLGYYDKSYRLSQMPLNQITAVINPVLQPTMSSMQNNLQDMALKYNKIIYFVSSISFPLGILLCLCGDEIIRLFFGEQWIESIPVFQILILSLMTQIVLSTSGAIWQSSNATNYMFWTGLANTMITLIGYFIGAFWGGTMETIALGWTISAFINFFNTYFFMYKRVLKSSFLKMLSIFINPLINAVIIAVSLLVYNYYLLMDNLIVDLFIKTFLSLLLSIFWLQISKRVDFIELYKSKFKK